MVAGGEHDLGVPDAVARLVFAELVGDPPEILGFGQERTGGDVLRDEVVEARESSTLADETRRRRGSRAVREVPDCGDPHRPFQMHVKPCLRESGEVSHPRMVATAGGP